MRVSDLDFDYPEDLVATVRAPVSRVLHVGPAATAAEPREIEFQNLIEIFQPNDVVVVNETKVLRRRVFTSDDFEILFLKPLRDDRTEWDVLCPSSRWKNKTTKTIEGTDIVLDLIERGRTQRVRCSRSLLEIDFDRFGELPIPPYIQKARGERHNLKGDATEYQTAWSRNTADSGSLAAPTASLHFDDNFERKVRERGVGFERVTLHVGLGTFLPVTVDDLSDHVMHSEWASIPPSTRQAIERARLRGGRVIAIGTTVARTLESSALNMLKEQSDGSLSGETSLLIKPGFQWCVVDVLLTNFHQPRSTLLALVASFSGLERIKAAYAWAIERKFRLFSYGDLTVLER